MDPRPLAGLLLALTMLLAACGGGGANQELIDALEAQGATAEQAECFVDAVGEEQAQLFADNIEADEPPEGIDIQAITEAVAECGIEG